MVAPKSVLEPASIEIGPEDIMRVLFIEHDTEYRQLITKDLENLGCSVDGADDPREAVEKLSARKYQIIIVDIGFPPPVISGDEFIAKYYSLMHKAQLVALTGQRHNIKCNREFEVLGVVIIDKGEEDVALKELSMRVYQRAKEDVLKRVNEAKPDLISGDFPRKHPLAEGYLLELENELMEKLNQIEDKNRKSIHYKGRDYSVSDIIEEVEQKTEVRDDLIRMMVKLIKWREQHGRSPHDMVKKPPQQI